MKISKTKGILLSVIIVLLVIVLIASTTYAFFRAGANNDKLVGTTYTVDFGIEATEIQKSSSLMPVSDSDIVKAVTKTSNKCVDKSNNELCSLYKIDLINRGNSTQVHGFIRTSSSTYTSNHLKYQVYDSNFAAITDVMTITHNSDDTIYFKKNNQNYVTSIGEGLNIPSRVSYYIVFWISEVNGPQNEDQEKTYNCKIGFESIYGDNLTSSFVVSA